jgi:O-antigen/teichoic acid export membrane protein
MSRKVWPELGLWALLLLLPLLLFAPVALGPRTLLPADILYLFEPYRTAAPALGVSYPQNHLVADLILQNYAWKRFLVEAFQNRELPLWDPYVFAGHPFLANGQHSALYPLSLVFYVLPLWRAFGVFVWLQLGLAGCFTYLFARVLGVRRLSGLIAGITFQFSGFMVVSAVHPMIIAASSWLPFVLAMAELVVQQRPALGRRPATMPWALLGAVGLGCQMLAGHAENTYFVLLVTAVYALWRLVGTWSREAGTGARRREVRRIVVGLGVLVGLGLALGAVQFIPLYEVVSTSFRGGEAAASLRQVRGWAYPPRRLITFAVPNFFGNPAHHRYFDLFTGRWTPALSFADGRYIDWGVKNYVEGGAYLGLLPLLLAAIAVSYPLVTGRPSLRARLRAWIRHPHVPFFTVLALLSLAFIFGTPLYALVYALPLLKQSHSPFRWIFPLTLAVAILAAFGVERVRESRRVRHARRRKGGASALGRLLLLGTPYAWISLVAALAFWGGILTLVGLVLSRLFFTSLEPLIARAFQSLALAPTAFPDHRAFYAYEFRWIAIFAVLLTGSGIVLRVSRCPIFVRRRPVWEFLAVGLLVLDFVTFGLGLNPAVDPALLAYTPPVVDFLQADQSLWRYASFTPPGTTKTMLANVGMFYDLQCVAGYDSLFSRRYADYMALIEPQDERQYNRIAAFRQWSSLDSPLTDLLNVKYVITEVEIPNPKYELVYQDPAVRVYRNLGVMERAYTMPAGAALMTDDFARLVQTHDPREYVILEPGAPVPANPDPQPGRAVPQRVTRYTINEVTVDVSLDGPGWLILTDAYAPGWKAFLRPQGRGEEAEAQVPVHPVNGTFRGVFLEKPGAWTVRFKYSPDSVKIGAFVSFIAGMCLLFLAGIYLWRFFYREEDDASTVRRVAKNSVAPIVINLFTRTIEMAFAALMARILGPVGNGRYVTAINIYLWFDILANFGLDMYLMREVARERSCGRRVFLNTTILRVTLFLGVAPLLAGFLWGRQSIGQPLSPGTIWATLLLYAGLLPGSLANGLAALFRACEKHEIPAAVQTVTTVIKVTLGVLALVGGLGIVGLAGASILTNTATLIILTVLARRLVWPRFPPQGGRFSWPLQRTMLGESWPLMASLLLQALFPGVNILLLQRLQGDAVVGWYDAARKWVDALNIVPSFFTFAVFPVVSRQAAQDREGLRRSYALALKLLTLLTVPLALSITLLSTPLVGALSGRRFLPQGAQILRLLVWSIVFGWLNSLTNYVLIALHRQRYVLIASGARVCFTVAANLLFVARFGYVASAWIIVAGELLLLALFIVDLRRHLGGLPWGRILGRPLLAGVAMGGLAYLLHPVSPVLALVAGLLAYAILLLVLRVLTSEEWALLAPLLPDRLRRLSGAWLGVE